MDDDRAVEVTFVIPRVVADGEITVAGEFNGWDALDQHWRQIGLSPVTVQWRDGRRVRPT